MTDLRIVTSEGTDLFLEEATVEQFAAGLRGPLLRAGDAGYDAARTVWNGMIDRRPALIARCAGVADVMAAVRFARAHRLLLAVRGGGHNITGNAVCEGGLMIDLSPMKSVRVDPQARTARAEAGLTWGEYNRRDAGLRPRQHRRRGFDHRHRRADPGWRTRLVDGEAWPQLRQPAVGRHRHRRRRVADR